jgi:hypothetical protein
MEVLLGVLGLGTLGWVLLFDAHTRWPRLWPLHVGAAVACTFGVSAWLLVVIPRAWDHARCTQATAKADLHLGAAIVTALAVLLGLALAGWLWRYGGRARERLAVAAATLITVALGVGWFGTCL